MSRIFVFKKDGLKKDGLKKDELFILNLIESLPKIHELLLKENIDPLQNDCPIFAIAVAKFISKHIQYDPIYYVLYDNVDYQLNEEPAHVMLEIDDLYFDIKGFREIINKEDMIYLYEEFCVNAEYFEDIIEDTFKGYRSKEFERNYDADKIQIAYNIIEKTQNNTRMQSLNYT